MDTSRLFGRQPAARMLAMKVLNGTDAQLGQIDISEMEIEEIIDENKWLRNWSSSMCEISGLEPGTPEFDRCQQSMAERAIMGAPMDSMTEGGCLGCGAGRTPLLAKARQLGQSLVD